MHTRSVPAALYRDAAVLPLSLAQIARCVLAESLRESLLAFFPDAEVLEDATDEENPWMEMESPVESGGWQVPVAVTFTFYPWGFEARRYSGALLFRRAWSEYSEADVCDYLMRRSQRSTRKSRAH